MKRIILITILAMIMLTMTGCATWGETSIKTKGTYYAQLIMPDGTIVEGKCTHLNRHSTGWIELYIDDVKYQTDQRRVVIWEER